MTARPGPWWLRARGRGRCRAAGDVPSRSAESLDIGPCDSDGMCPGGPFEYVSGRAVSVIVAAAAAAAAPGRAVGHDRLAGWAAQTNHGSIRPGLYSTEAGPGPGTAPTWADGGRGGLRDSKSHLKSCFRNVKAFNLKKIKMIAEPVNAKAARGPAAGG